MTTSGFGDFGNLFGEEFLGLNPRTAFQSFDDQFGRTPGRKRFIRNAFSEIQDQYLGQLGRIARQGQIPKQSFTSFLDTFDFDQFASGFSPAARGEGIANFNPRTRFNF